MNRRTWAAFTVLTLPVALLAARADASTAADNATVSVTSWAIVDTYDPQTGVVLNQQRIDGPTSSVGTTSSPTPYASGVGGTSTASGCRKIYVYQRGTSMLGHTTWMFYVWTDWCWTRWNQTVHMKAHSYDFTTDGYHKFAGIVAHASGYYDFGVNDGHPKSAYHNYKRAEFDGQSVLGQNSYEYPRNTLDSYYNGTYTWYTS